MLRSAINARARGFSKRMRSPDAVSGPYDGWPTHQGFEKFHGFIGGETNQWDPQAIVLEDTKTARPALRIFVASSAVVGVLNAFGYFRRAPGLSR